jgi:hypothetical protein
MQKVSLRTLVLMLELLLAVVALQYMVMAKPARASVVWLAGDGLASAAAPSGEMAPPAAP